MKKLLLAVLIGIFCFGAVNTFTQESKKKETTQPKTVRVETENKVLNEQIRRLNTQINNLASQNKRLDARVKKLESEMKNLAKQVRRIDYMWPYD